MDSDLMCSSWNRVTLQKTWVCFLIIKYLSESCLAVLYIRILTLLFFVFFLIPFHLFSDFIHLFVLNFIFFILSLLLLGLKFLRDSVNSIFMRDAFNLCVKSFLIPWKIAINSRKVHFLHFFILILLVEDLRFLLRLTINDQSWSEPIQSMEDKQIFVSFLNLENWR